MNPSAAGPAAAPSRLTFCSPDENLVRVWGIAPADRERHEYIERILEMNHDRLIEGMGMPTIADLKTGCIVLVREGEHFKRGSIIRQEPGSNIFRVRLIDVGSSLKVTVDDIRVTSAIPHLRPLGDAPCVQDYILGDALAKLNAWSMEDVQWASYAVRVSSDIKILDLVAGKTLISWTVLHSQSMVPFCQFLAQRGLAHYAPLADVKMAVMRKFAPYPMTIPPPRMPEQMLLRRPFAPPEMMPPMASPPLRPPPGLGMYPRPPPSRMAQQHIVRNQFKVDTLPVGTQHEAHVSHVVEGVQSFMIQLKKNVNRLAALMVAINDSNYQPEPIDQLNVGIMCLGRFSEDRTLCRAVVSMVLTDAANLLFVDFGNSEAVPFDEIYKIPPQFLEEPIMALSFTLAGLSHYPALLTQEARQIFEELVAEAEYLLLSVTKPEIHLKQYCELYIHDGRGAKVNIKQKVLDKMKLMKPVEYKKLSFKQNSSNDVIVSYVESPTRFFVQLEVNQPLLETLMTSVEEYCLTAINKDFLYYEDVNENMAICCQFADDNKWYRGLIADEPMGDENVLVFYVDYGNSETVHFTKLRVMNNEMISKLPMQAVECRLDIDPDFALREEVIEAFVELVDLNSYKMKVINVLPANVLLVDLFDEQNQNVKDMLLSLFTEVEEPVSPLADNTSKSAASQGSGNWRERKSSSNDGDFSAFRREDQQQRTRGKSDTDDRGRRNSDYKRQDSRGHDETDDATRFSGKEHSSSDRWPQDRADKRSPREDWSSKSNGRDDDRYGGKPRDDDRYGGKPRDDDRYGGKSRDDGGSRRSDRDGEDRYVSRDGERKPYRRQDDGDSRGGGGSRSDYDGERKPYRKRDDSGSQSSRDSEHKKYSRDDRRGGGGYRKNDDDWNRGKAEWNGEKSADDWSGGAKKSDSSWGGKRNDSDFGGRSNNSDWNSKKTDDWSNKKSDNYGNQKNDNFGNQKSDDWGGKKNDDWGGKKNDSDWKGKSSFDRDDRRPRRDNDYKPRDGSYNSRDGNRQRGGGYGAQTDSFKSTPALSDGYPAGSQIAESEYQVGQQMAVEISWFLNPVHFFIIPANNADFRQLMETMQPDYPQRKNAELNSLSPGVFVAARAKDDVIYRAKVIQTRPGGATVSFVDYGNSESISRNQIWTISGDHCSQPIQAICCGLHNISSTGEGGQWSLPDDGEKYFGKDKYTVSFVECREEASSKTLFVNLHDENNQDIADLLVADGLAVKNNVMKSEELYDIELLRDQILTVFPGHIDSSKKFFVHIEPPKAEMIQQNIATLVETPESLIPLPTEKICEGEFCLAMAEDEVYYRAQILSINEAEKVARVVYIDYGDENDVAFDAVKTLPEYLMIYNPQIVECCLHDADSFTNEEAFHEALKETDFMIKVMDVIDNKLSVFVYDINGARLPYPMEVEENVDVLCSLPMLKSCEQVFITHVTSDKVYLSRTSDTAYITDLCDELMKHYDAEELSKVPLEPGVFYAAKSKLFESWYRCILPSADSQEVYYIDYGNTELVEDLLAVKPLDKSFFVSPTYCVAASTSITFTCSELTPLIDTVASVLFKAKFERQPNGWYVDLKCEKTGKTLSDIATECECSFESIESKTNAVQKYAAFNEWQLNDEKNVVVAHIFSPNSFYLHLSSDVEKIQAMQQSLQCVIYKLLPVVGPVDGLCAAQKSDGQWCRVAIIDQQSVFAVDFGETLTSPVIKKLPLSFAEDQSNYIVECSLNVNPIEDSWSDAAVARFRDLVGSGKEIMAKLEFQKSPKLIDLIVDSVSVGSTLVNENLAQWKCHEVVVSHANSLDDFYIQEPELVDDLYELGDKLKEADTWESVEPVVDDLVVAQYDEDQQWYRAVVVKIEEDVKHVRFIDYGNESACSRFRVLPDSLKSIPRFTSKCSLHSIPENRDTLDEKFVDLVSSADGSFTAYFLNRVEPMLVMLYYNNTAIEDVLQEKPVEEIPVSTNEVPTEYVVFDNVAVCHINSPSSFYVQSETAPLDNVATALFEVENAPVAEPVVGNVVAALFPDDGVWYRAKICDMTDGISVLFIDYGNSCIVEQLRQLPETTKNIPALAKHCAFTLPAGLDQWPDIANQRFAELTCEGNTIFKLNLLEEGDPAYVDLQDVGVNVADELATLCKADLTATPLLSRAAESAVLLSHVESLSELWIQFQSPQLDEMADEMGNAETFEATDAADEGSLVAALFDDDGAWYRAKVIKVADKVYDVLFIDYGNGSSTSSIKSLPADLVNLPALAKCCRLKDFVEVAEGHVDAVLAKLKGMADAAQSFTVRELVEIDGVNYVSLVYDGDQDLTTVMRTFYDALVTSDVPESSQLETVIEEPQVNETAEPVQDVDMTENVESVVAPSEGVADSENVVKTVPDVSEQITSSKDEQITDLVESKVEESVENAEKTPVLLEKGDVKPVSSQNAEKEPVSCKNAEEESISSPKSEKMPEKIHEVDAVASTDDSFEVTETPSEIAIPEDILSGAEKPAEAESEPNVGEDLSHGDDVEKVEEEPAVTPDQSFDSSLVSENRYSVVCAKDVSTAVMVTTPSLPTDNGDTSSAAFDLTPDFKTPASKFAFDTETTSSDDDSNPDHFESAVGPADSASPFSAPGDVEDETKLMDFSMESRDEDDDELLKAWAKNGTVVEVYTIDGMTPNEFIEKHGNDGSSESASNAGQSVDEVTTVGLPPFAEEEEFTSLESSDSVPVAAQDVEHVNVHVVPASESMQYYSSGITEALQFADADETSADDLADMLSGMTISEKSQKTPAPSEIELLSEAPSMKIDQVEVHDLIEFSTDSDSAAQSKSDPEFEEDSQVLQDLTISSDDIPTETCNTESEMVVLDQPSQTEQLKAAKPSGSDELTDVPAKSDENDESAESSTANDSPLEVEMVEVAEESTGDVAQLSAKTSETSEVHDENDQVTPKVEYTMVSDSVATEQPLAEPSDSPSNEEKSLSEEPAASEAVDESSVTVAKDDKKIPECENTLSEDVPKEASVSSIATDISNAFFGQLVASVTDEDKLLPVEPIVSKESDESVTTVVDDDETSSACEKTSSENQPIVGQKSDESAITVVKDDNTTSEFENTFSENAPEESVSFIATHVASEFFDQIVASADDEFNSTSNPFLSAEDTLGLVSSDSESDDVYDSTPGTSFNNDDRDDSTNVAQSQTSVKSKTVTVVDAQSTSQDDSVLQKDSNQSSSTAKCDSPAPEHAAYPLTNVEGQHGASVGRLVDGKNAQSPTGIKDTLAQRLPAKEERTSLSLAISNGKVATTVADVSSASRDIGQSPPTVGDVSGASADNHQLPPAVEDTREPENFDGDLSVESFKYVPKKRMPIRPELSQPSASATLDKNIVHGDTGSPSVAAETAPDLPVDAKPECSAELSEDDDESLPSSGAAEVAHTLANVCQRDDSDEETSPQRHRPRPPKITNRVAATSKQSANTTDVPESAASTCEQDDNSSVYFDSCAEPTEPRSVELSDDEQQPTSFTSSTSEETSVASGGDADDEGPDQVVVSYVNTPDNFFVQKVTAEKELRNIEKQLGECKKTEVTPLEVRPGKGGVGKAHLYGAEIDDNLYRVSVLEVKDVGESGAEYTVCCTDYGRVGQVQKLFSLPENLQTADSLAMACSIQLPYYLKTWPVDVCQEFERVVTTNRPKFVLKCRQILNGVAVVDLVRGRRSISQRMKTLCEEFNENKACDVKQGKSSTSDE